MPELFQAPYLRQQFRGSEHPSSPEIGTRGSAGTGGTSGTGAIRQKLRRSESRARLISGGSDVTSPSPSAVKLEPPRWSHGSERGRFLPFQRECHRGSRSSRRVRHHSRRAGIPRGHREIGGGRNASIEARRLAQGSPLVSQKWAGSNSPGASDGSASFSRKHEPWHVHTCHLPVDHRLTPKVRIAILAVVEDAKSVKDAAAVAGLTVDAIRKAMRDNPVARAFYSGELKALMHFAKAKAAHALIKELDGPNAAARVAAARTLLEENQSAPAGNNMPQVPGFAILIADARSFQQPIDVTPLPTSGPPSSEPPGP